MKAEPKEGFSRENGLSKVVNKSVVVMFSREEDVAGVES